MVAVGMVEGGAAGGNGMWGAARRCSTHSADGGRYRSSTARRVVSLFPRSPVPARARPSITDNIEEFAGI